MSDPTHDDRRARGRAMFEEVYGEAGPAPPPGAVPAFELLVLDQQFAEVWSRRALPIPLRRLLTIGVVAATGRVDTLQMQFRRTLEVGELTVEQVREAAIHLVTYLGMAAAGGIFAASEAAITAHLEQQRGES